MKYVLFSIELYADFTDICTNELYEIHNVITLPYHNYTIAIK